jgi:hypothetical protein
LNTDQKIEIKHLSNQVLHGFMRCPYRFYWQHIKGKGADHVDWRELVQYVINKVIHHYYLLPLGHRSSFQILKLIEKYWKLEVKWFDSKSHYYTVLASITDHLIQQLNSKEEVHPPLFLFEKYNIKSEELQTNISMTLQVGEWTEDSFTIKKYLVDGDKDIINLYYHFTLVMTDVAFAKLPESIEIISLLTGKSYVFHPTEEDIKESYQYLQLFKRLLENPTNYIKTDTTAECIRCPFLQKCNPILKEKRFMQH